MTNDSNSNDELRDLLAELTRKQIASQYELDMLIENTNRILGRDAILNDVILEVRENTQVLQQNFEIHQQNFERHQETVMRLQANFEIHQQNFERHQRNFDENQRTTNAALNSLEAILLQLTRNGRE
jgi:hypothetical protein